MNLNLTHLVICDNDIIGYVTLLSDTIKLKVIEDEKTKNEIKEELNISENNEVPAIKIGRLAVDKKYSKKGLGSHILGNVLLNIIDVSNNIIGLRFVTVDAYASAFDFYTKKFNFLSQKSDEKILKKNRKNQKTKPQKKF